MSRYTKEIPGYTSLKTETGIEQGKVQIPVGLLENVFTKPVKFTNDGFVEILDVDEPHYRLVYKVHVKYINELYSTDYDKAVADYKIADYTDWLKIEPNSGTLKDRGDVYYDKGDYDKAIADYTAALEQEEKDEEKHMVNWMCKVHIRRGRAYAHKKEFEKAIADMREVVRIAPDNTDGYPEKALQEVLEWQKQG